MAWLPRLLEGQIFPDLNPSMRLCHSAFTAATMKDSQNSRMTNLPFGGVDWPYEIVIYAQICSASK